MPTAPSSWDGRRESRTALTSRNSDMVFVGYGIVAPEYNWNDYAGVDVKGKTVVMLVNDPGFATQDTALFKGNEMTYYGRWTYKYDEAARQGAAAAIIVLLILLLSLNAAAVLLRNTRPVMPSRISLGLPVPVAFPCRM